MISLRPCLSTSIKPWGVSYDPSEVFFEGTHRFCQELDHIGITTATHVVKHDRIWGSNTALTRLIGGHLRCRIRLPKRWLHVVGYPNVMKRRGGGEEGEPSAYNKEHTDGRASFFPHLLDEDTLSAFSRTPRGHPSLPLLFAARDVILRRCWKNKSSSAA